ncbi:hypothetical protein LTR66_005213 [Elasticomyces elasticus]|nr:hypothetical protein LTR66_005213 [Elasticomyces elasticus]KAK5010653.1 hypothetical protein LTR28_008522 [Elasticomyces elasticus]
MAFSRQDVSDPRADADAYPKTNSKEIARSMPAATMRVAIAGTGGLACAIAHCVHEETSHQVVMLSRESRRQQPALPAHYQVQQVDYSDQESLKYALRGTDTVISTVTGASQIELIKAAVAVNVRRFAPAEFEGPPHLRPQTEFLDRGKNNALLWLQHYQQHIQSTVFVCGILYERFQPGGLAQSVIGLGCGIPNEGDYMMNLRTMSAQLPIRNAADQPSVTICMTGVRDVGRFVTRALDWPGQWPPELRMVGERITVYALSNLIQELRGEFNFCENHNPESLASALAVASLNHDLAEQLRLHHLLATAQGRYDYEESNLNTTFGDIRPEAFRAWVTRSWHL